MEYVPGGSVAQALKRFGPFVEPVFCRYTKQILRGVEYLHVNNVMHRYAALHVSQSLADAFIPLFRLLSLLFVHSFNHSLTHSVTHSFVCFYLFSIVYISIV